MRRLMLLAVSMLTVVCMAVSPAFAHDWDGDGWDEDLGTWVVPFSDAPVDWDVDWVGDEDADWGDANCEVVDVDWSDVFEEWQVDVECS